METIFGDSLSESSKKLYMHNLKKLNGNVEPKSLSFLKKKSMIDEYLNKLKPNTKRSYIIAIVSATKNKPSFKSVNAYYYKQMMDINSKLKDSTMITKREEDNWITQDVIKEKMNELILKISKNHSSYNDILNALILGLYVLQPPRRNIDYVMMTIQEEKGFNYLDLEKNKFIFTNYKTAKTYNTQTVDISNDLKPIIELYLKVRESDSNIFLIDSKGNPFKNSNTITRVLNKIFKNKISSTMLRKIYLTDKYENVMKEMSEDVADMGTSTSVAQSNYIKQK